MKEAYGGKFIYDSLHEILIYSGRAKDDDDDGAVCAAKARAFTFN